MVISFRIWGASSKFWGFTEPSKKVKKNLTLKEMPSFRLIFYKKSSASPDSPWQI